MFPKMNPKQMEKMMRQLGMQTEEIQASRVLIEGEKNYEILNPVVSKISVQGQETFQIQGELREIKGAKFNEEDVELVMEKTGKQREEVEKVLEETEGDITEAIIKLK